MVFTGAIHFHVDVFVRVQLRLLRSRVFGEEMPSQRHGTWGNTAPAAGGRAVSKGPTSGGSNETQGVALGDPQ